MQLDAVYREIRNNVSEADALYILEKRADIQRIELITSPSKVISKEKYIQIISDINAVRAGKPLSRIYNEQEFWGRRFLLCADTLDPRQDTEALIEVVLDKYKNSPPSMILDLGIGSGCILTTLLCEFPDAYGLGVDLSLNALKTARENALYHNVLSRMSFVCASWMDAFEGRNDNGKFDLVVSNPPYISNQIIPDLDENVQKYDPILALDGGEGGLKAYEVIFSNIFSSLKKGGSLVLEIGFDQAESVMRLSKESGFSSSLLFRDSTGSPRVVDNF